MKINASSMKIFPRGGVPLLNQDLLDSVKVANSLENELIGLLKALKIKVNDVLEKESEQDKKEMMNELLEVIDMDEYNIRHNDLSKDEIKDIAFFYTGYRKLITEVEKSEREKKSL